MSPLKSILFIFVFICSSLIFTSDVYARGGGGAGGGHSLGVGIITTSPSQDDLDATISSNNASGRSISKFGSGFEYSAYYQYRFSGSIFAFQFRPSLFTQKTDGSGYKYDLTGTTVFPIFRMYPLENSFIHFFMQAGIGYGSMTGKIDTPTNSITFSGGAFGAIGGLGAEFCFTDNHCATVEGNIRYLPIQRNVVTASNADNGDGFSQSTRDMELEAGGSDVKTTMSGVQGGLFYHYNF